MTELKADDATREFLDDFVRDIRRLLGPVAVWAHGSLGGGDYQPGRSDLDLLAVSAGPRAPGVEEQLARTHRRLLGELPFGPLLHCGYLVATELDDPADEHLAWAHRELYHRPVTPVTRRELHTFGVVRHRPGPAGRFAPGAPPPPTRTPHRAETRE
ncbi:nucleotidyltransferase domain-containing protein, partial [Streptomyces sp. NPDC055078]